MKLHTIGLQSISILLVCGLNHWLLGSSLLIASVVASSLTLGKTQGAPSVKQLWLSHILGASLGTLSYFLIPTVSIAATVSIIAFQYLGKRWDILHIPASATTLIFLQSSAAGSSPAILFLALGTNLGILHGLYKIQLSALNHHLPSLRSNAAAEHPGSPPPKLHQTSSEVHKPTEFS